MAYTLPTLEELVQQAQERHRAELPGTDAFLWPNTEYVLMKAVAGMVHMNFRYLEWIKRQRFATEADGDQLDAHGRPWGIARNAATRATGTIAITGTPLATIDAATQFQRSDGVQFTTLAEVTLDSGGSATVAVEADDTGTAGNTAPNAELAPLVSNPDIDTVTVNEIGIGGGTDIEGDESYRARILFRMRNPPRGGAAHDYVFWASSVPGVTRVWVEDLAFGPGTVGVWFMTDDMAENGIPSDVSVEDVADYIATVRPETARVIVKAPIAASIDVTISGITPSQAQQALIQQELEDVFRRRVAVSTVRSPYTLPASLLWQAVARVMGDATHSIRIPAADVLLPAGYIPVLGVICYI